MSGSPKSLKNMTFGPYGFVRRQDRSIVIVAGMFNGKFGYAARIKGHWKFITDREGATLSGHSGADTLGEADTRAFYEEAKEKAK